MWVDWWDAETGAPGINPKRPYGNSSVEEDVCRILTGETIGRVDSKRQDLIDEEKKKYFQLHTETETALQIVLSTGKFQPGVYQAEEYGNNWRLVKEKKKTR